MSVQVIDEKLLLRMPLLSELVQRQKEQLPLVNSIVLLIQHQLQDSYAQVSSLLELGVDPTELYWIDIPYTSNASVRSAVQRLGVPARNFWSHAYHLGLQYRSYQCSRVHKWISELGEGIDRARKLIVIDDGAYFLEVAADIGWVFPNLCAVEQSQSGIKLVRTNMKIRNYITHFPVINVAESEPKKVLEAPMIARAISDALWESLSDRLHVSPSNDHCLILGYGSIGAAVASMVPQRFGFCRSHIYVYDPIPERQAIATKLGHPAWKSDESTTHFKLVIGCSGERAFTIDDITHVQNGAFLASASTGSSELSKEELVELAAAENHPEIEIKDPTSLEGKWIHSDLELCIRDRRVVFLNGGFPINFDGRHIDRIPPEEIQLTAALMVRGALQAATTNACGIVRLDELFCHQITENFTKTKT
jgi:S-adenosylhomocysteine hydrolase